MTLKLSESRTLVARCSTWGRGFRLAVTLSGAVPLAACSDAGTTFLPIPTVSVSLSASGTASGLTVGTASGSTVVTASGSTVGTASVPTMSASAALSSNATGSATLSIASNTGTSPALSASAVVTGSASEAVSANPSAEVSASSSASLVVPDAGWETDAGDAAGDTGSDAGVTTDSATPEVPDASEPTDSSVSTDTGTVTEPDASEPVLDAAQPPFKVAVSCSWTGDDVATERVAPTFTLTNTESTSLSLLNVVIYYYFSADGRDATLDETVYFSEVNGTAHATEASPGVGADADHRLVISFTNCVGSTCTLDAGDSVEIQTAIIASSNGQMFNGTNDYSYGSGISGSCPSVVVMQGSSLIFGMPPG